MVVEASPVLVVGLVGPDLLESLLPVDGETSEETVGGTEVEDTGIVDGVGHPSLQMDPVARDGGIGLPGDVGGELGPFADIAVVARGGELGDRFAGETVEAVHVPVARCHDDEIAHDDGGCDLRVPRIGICHGPQQFLIHRVEAVDPRQGIHAHGAVLPGDGVIYHPVSIEYGRVDSTGVGVGPFQRGGDGLRSPGGAHAR